MALNELLLCEPSHFALRYAINPWMRTDVEVDVARALDEWQCLLRAIEPHAKVRLVEPAPDCPDMCFTANAGLVHRNVFVPSRFRYAERRAEEPHFAAWFESAGFACRPLANDLFFEGAGDALFDRDGRLWMGYGPRTDRACAAALSGLLDIDVVALHLVDARFYHLDTCFCPLSNGHVVYFPGAFDRDSLDAIECRVPASRRIRIGEDDASAFACNIVDLGDRIVVRRMSDELRRSIERTGIEVACVALDEFMKSGGAAKCLTLALG